MKEFDFDKFSRSSWIGSSLNRAWKRYGVKTHSDSAKDERGEHNFLTPLPTNPERGYTERCSCGWSGECWADHLAERVEGTTEAVEPSAETVEEEVEEKPKKRTRASKIEIIKPAG